MSSKSPESSRLGLSTISTSKPSLWLSDQVLFFLCCFKLLQIKMFFIIKGTCLYTTVSYFHPFLKMYSLIQKLSISTISTLKHSLWLPGQVLFFLCHWKLFQINMCFHQLRGLPLSLFNTVSNFHPFLKFIAWPGSWTSDSHPPLCCNI